MRSSSFVEFSNSLNFCHKSSNRVQSLLPKQPILLKLMLVKPVQQKHKLNETRQSLPWAWHSSAPACFPFFHFSFPFMKNFPSTLIKHHVFLHQMHHASCDLLSYGLLAYIFALVPKLRCPLYTTLLWFFDNLYFLHTHPSKLKTLDLKKEIIKNKTRTV